MLHGYPADTPLLLLAACLLWCCCCAAQRELVIAFFAYNAAQMVFSFHFFVDMVTDTGVSHTGSCTLPASWNQWLYPAATCCTIRHWCHCLCMSMLVN